MNESTSSISRMTCNTFTTSINQYSDNGDKICDTCIKQDVCMFKDECTKAVKDIRLIAERTNIFIDTDIRCKKWSGKISNIR